MKLSILIPMYNAEKYIGNCLDSLINQDISKDEYEIIVMDDGSTDDSMSIVKKYIDANENIFIYSHPNCGLGATRNKAMLKAKGEYIYFIDSDDYIAYNTFGKLIKYAIGNNVDILSFNTQVTEQINLFTSNNSKEPLDIKILNGCEFLAKYKYHRLEAWWYFIKRDFLLKTGVLFIEGKFMEDAVFTFKLFLAAKKTTYLPLDIHRYVKTPNSIMNYDNPTHLSKVINDYVSLIFSFNELITEISNSRIINSTRIIDNIKFKSTASLYFLFFKFIRANISISKIDKILKELKKIKIYPLTNFIGEVYSHRKIKITAFIFNNKYLFYLLLYPIRFLHKLKLIKLF